LHTFIVYSYFIYLAISLAVTIWVARTLHRRGRVFLVDAFHGQEDLADSVNHLLVVGFYLINVGYVTFMLRTSGTPANLRQAIELVSDKLGVVLLVLGVMHFFNLYVFSRIRTRAKENAAPPPFAPDIMLAPKEG
jgi:TRAP-type C4-dicarboxylate transport system permease large subunit